MTIITVKPSILRLSDGTTYQPPLPHRKAKKIIRRGNRKDDRPAGPLYHYTFPENVESIVAEGLTRGDTPTDVRCTPGNPYGAGCSGIWMTTVDRLGEPHGWMTTAPEKCKARFTVEIPQFDSRLWLWDRFAASAKIDETTLTELNRCGGSEHEQWYVYFGVIPPEWLRGEDPKPTASNYVPDWAKEG